MRKTFLLVSLLAALAIGGAYVTSPLLAAVKLRQAIASGDTETVDRMVAWPSFRESLRRTIASNAQLLPAAQDTARSLRPTMWQRIRSLFGHTMLDRFIEHYITPKGLTTLYRAKQRRYGEDKKPEFIQAGISFEQIRRTWTRVKRAEFVTPFRFVLEIEDQHLPARRIESTFVLDGMSLTGFEWKLVTVTLRNPSAKEARLGRLNGF